MTNSPHVSHVEWRCTDLQRTRKFLTSMFGWKFEPFGSNYYLYTPEQGTCVGLIAADQVVPGNNCLVFIQVTSIMDYLKKAVSLHSKVVVPRKEIPNYGWYAQIYDPDGNIGGLFEGAKPQS